MLLNHTKKNYKDVGLIRDRSLKISLNADLHAFRD